MNNYYLSLSPDQEYTAWYKAIADVEYFLNSIAFKPIPIRECVKDMENCLANLLSYNENESTTDNAGMILLQYPRVSFEGLNISKFTNLIKSNYKNYRLVILVHDLDSIRYGDFFTTNTLKEVPILNRFDYVIAVNDAMSALLEEHGVVAKLSSLTLFDYALSDITNDIKTSNKQNDATIAYVGNLKYAKSPFIYELNQMDFGNAIINLYGPGLDNEKFQSSKNVHYMGAFPADDLANEINACFGLCWDGTNLDSCVGQIGQYLRYTNPHKTSFYLALGLPIIISKDISTATFIEREHVGIIIESLYDIPRVLNGISSDEYQLLKENAIKLSAKLRNGYFMKQTISDIEKSITSQLSPLN